MVKEINDSVFKQEVLDSSKTTIVDFWASWCGPCKMLGPVIDEIAQELKDKAEFVKVNVDENPMASSQYRVASIPTVMVFKGGKVVETLVGFRPKQALKSAIEKHI
ncbi:thioredoxin 1 [Clostridium tetanomorphum]|uniref:Thioredoxin n=1 Tax=Clostridium tetanomorphum TaxID=1553 RepID=A0A923IZR0_CLOTT|nr:thioredoxin [Clostridium tetanomorphum]KAJ52278.1 thioredoxin [Clostridium tetanomorphum DSM 665]MBC2397571.1 thioredoxin [Clostridium tetanomorphum]MBP1863717.1 thioredoxin 1 [Clostridium tetanomorphum]NRS86293.1 thioredoxin 1 [Clostridium tetanomorphum]NRZ95677.1 thioredoxin 1 [Clostridium tetanomorphum]